MTGPQGSVLAVAEAVVRDSRVAALEEEVTRLRAEVARLEAARARKQPRAGYAARRTALIAQGNWHPYVPAAPVRAYVRRVMDATGMSVRQFAVAAGVNEGTISKILYQGQGRVLTAVGVKIRQVTPATPVPDAGWASPHGSCRRLQALAVAGWSPLLLAARLGMDPGAVRKIRDGVRQRVSPATARRIRAVYDELWDTAPPMANRNERIAAGKTRAYAARHGWAPAQAWDDDQIDMAGTRPADDWERAAESRRRDSAGLAAEARELFTYGVSRDAAARRLGVTRAALDKALERAPADVAGDAG